MLTKIDLAKAYNKLNCGYLQQILKAYGFDNKWINWVMSMITMPVMLVLLNKSLTEAFNPSRALRQGNPISPFLFIIGVDGLGRLIKANVNSKQLKGLRLWEMTHL